VKLAAVAVAGRAASAIGRAAPATAVHVVSQSGAIAIDVSSDGGRLGYAVSPGRAVAVERSCAGIVVDGEDLGANPVISRGTMVNFHGASKPTGEARTWAHEPTREAVFGLEHRHARGWTVDEAARGSRGRRPGVLAGERPRGERVRVAPAAVNRRRAGARRNARAHLVFF
jgi:hypothetical protein